MFFAEFLEFVNTPYCSDSSPRSCVGQKKAMLELYQSLSKKTSMSGGFLLKAEYWVTCCAGTQPVLHILG